MSVKRRGEGVQPSEVLAHQDRQPGAARLDDAHSLATAEVLVDRCGQAIGQPPQLQVLLQEVERMNLPLADEHLARARVEHHGFVRRRRGTVHVSAACHDQAQPAGARALALPERDLPALEQRAGQAELGCKAERHVVLIPGGDHLFHPRRDRLAIGGMDAVEAHPGALLLLPFELVGLADHRGGGYAEAGFALRPGET